jgi:hypothetical protein
MDQLGVVLVVVLFPGIVATVLADKLTVHSRWRSFKYILYSLVLGVLSYALLQLIVYAGDIWEYACTGALKWTQLGIWKVAHDGTMGIPPWEVVSAVFVALPLALLASACIQHKWLTRFGAWLRITDKFGDENLYTFFLNTREVDWVYVRDPDKDLTYQGRVFSFSENDQTRTQELILYDVTTYRYKDSAELYSVPTAYLSSPMGKLIIETVPPELLKATHDDQATE